MKKVLLTLLLLVDLSFGLEKEGEEASENPTDICAICTCNYPLVDCRNRGLSTPDYVWPEWKNFLINLDFNFFSRLTKFPPTKTANLSFAHNRLQTIEGKTFEDLESLTELNLSHNYLADLHPEIFYGQYDPEHYRPLKLLRVLDLSDNRLASLHQDLFLHLPNLEILNLSHNPIKIIDDNTRMALSKIPVIKVLDLSYTAVGDLPEYFLHNANFLRILNLEGDNFTRVPQEFFNDGHESVFVNLENNPVNLPPSNKTKGNNIIFVKEFE